MYGVIISAFPLSFNYIYNVKFVQVCFYVTVPLSYISSVLFCRFHIQFVVILAQWEHESFLKEESQSVALIALLALPESIPI